VSISVSERDTYESMWGAVEGYSRESPGERYLPAFLQMVGSERGTVLDAGCGTGKAALALEQAGFSVTLCDLTADGIVADARHFRFERACLWQASLQFGIWRYDYGFCCDVLEHVPTQFTMLAVARLLEACKRGVFLSVSLVPDQYGMWVGKALHQTVQPYEWWLASLGELGEIVEARDLLDVGIYFVKPRR